MSKISLSVFKRIICAVCVMSILSAALLTGCGAPATVTVPDVVGMTQADAEQAITDLGLTMTVARSRFSNNNPEGSIDAMVTEANTEAEPGSEVKVVLSQGEGVQVPGMWVLTGAEAANLLTKVGLNPIIVEEYSDDVEAGNIITYTDSGQTLPVGSDVTLTVSKGPEA